LTVLPPLRLPISLGRWPGAIAGTGREVGRDNGLGRPPARNAAVMGAGTVFSRLSGFARLLAVGWVLGQGHLADAYNLANTVPNIIYELLLGGVLSATLLPVLMQLLNSRRPEDEDGVPAVVSFLTVFLVVATALFWLAAPEIIRFYLSGASGSGVAGERALAVDWLRLFAPQLLFIGLISITTALLNARRRFGSVAFSPVLANVVTILALLVADHMVAHASVNAYRADSTAIVVVGIGTTAGYLAQLLAQLPALFAAHVRLRPRWRPGHAALKTLVRLSGWTFGAVVANQLSYTLVAYLAASKGGDFSAFTYAYAFMLLPHAVVAVSIGYVVAPDLAQLWSEGNSAGFATRVGQAVRATMVLLVPGAVGYALVARPAAILALAHGTLKVGSASLTGALLVIFALGLPGYSSYLLLMRAFQSKQDTRSMFWLYVFENTLTVVAALALYPFVGVRGLVVGWIGAYTLTLPLAWRRLRASAPVSVAPDWLARVFGATAIMALAVAGALRLLPAAHSTAWSSGRLGVVIVVGAAIFVWAGRALGVRELTGLTSRFRAVVH
jgi:putative peptidoglycan lipid II flippase